MFTRRRILAASAGLICAPAIARAHVTFPVGTGPIHSGGGSTAWVLTVPFLGSSLNVFTGTLGVLFTVGGAPITVTSIGRWMQAGNSATHTLYILDAATNPATVVASTTLNLSGGTVAAFNYATVSSPPVLTAGHNYIVSSSEVSSTGDTWYDQTTTITTTSVAAAIQPAQTDGSFNWTTTATTNESYGPMDFKYHL